jgi:hypothetical protein
MPQQFPRTTAVQRLGVEIARSRRRAVARHTGSTVELVS